MRIKKLKKTNKYLITIFIIAVFAINIGVFTNSSKKTKVYLLNDTRFNKNHIGCEIVMQTIIDFCKTNNLKIIGTDFQNKHRNKTIDNKIKKYLKKSDLIIVNGEGTLHDDRGINILEQAKYGKQIGKKVVLINSVWQKNKELCDYLDYFDLISVRESLSKKEMQKCHNFARIKNKVFIVPDLTFYKPVIKNKSKQDLIIFTDDNETAETELLFSIFNKLKENDKNNKIGFYVLGERMDGCLDKYNLRTINEDDFSKMSQNSKIISGRFHALTLALKYNIPTLMIPSNTHKIEGLLKDAKLEKYVVENNNIFENKVKIFLIKNHNEFIKKSKIYSKNAEIKINDMFNKIIEISKN